jgi:hypothetical protein
MLRDIPLVFGSFLLPFWSDWVDFRVWEASSCGREQTRWTISQWENRTMELGGSVGE